MGKRDQFGNSKGKYDDAFQSVMQYVEIRLDGAGKRIKIKDKQDLKTLFERLDASRQDKKGDKRMSPGFIQRLLETKSAERVLGGTIGRFGAKEQRLKQPSTPVVTAKVRMFEQQGKQVYHYHGGYATKTVYKSPKGKIVTRFRSVKTGRFIKSSTIES